MRMCVVCGEEVDMEKRQYGCVWSKSPEGALLVGFAHLECMENCKDIEDITLEVTGEKPNDL